LSSIADRVRGIVHSGPEPIPAVSARRDTRPGRDTAEIWGGERRDGCHVVQRQWEPSAIHGREVIGAIANRLRDAADEAPLFARGAPARPPFMFFDLETTGLNGGAGTHAFLVGCGWFDDGRFVTRQFVMTRHADERAMLETVARECAHAGALVSFNGKSFDAPMLETRYLFHRLSWFGGEKPHLDLLHPARQFWRREDCSLQALERQLVGYRRRGDVAGFDVPARYFQFVRTGNPEPLCQVLEHNRLDLVTLAALTARLLDLARQGPEAARDSREALALGHVFMRAGLERRARAAFERAIALSRAPSTAFDPVRIDALRALALAWRRAREFDRAAHCWQGLLELRACPTSVAAEAAEALAIHHEHRLHDFREAHRLASSTLGAGLTERRTDAVKWRLNRLERRLAEQPAFGLLDQDAH
jgi:uncharacterized protein YprB with RNaseH-like and TPR domain